MTIKIAWFVLEEADRRILRQVRFDDEPPTRTEQLRSRLQDALDEYAVAKSSHESSWYIRERRLDVYFWAEELFKAL